MEKNCSLRDSSWLAFSIYLVDECQRQRGDPEIISSIVVLVTDPEVSIAFQDLASSVYFFEILAVFFFKMHWVYFSYDFCLGHMLTYLPAWNRIMLYFISPIA